MATAFDVAQVAELARLDLSADERALFQKQLEGVLHYVEHLKQLDRAGVETAGPMQQNVFRKDEPRDWFTSEEALSNAPQQANHLFIVPKVIE